MNIVCGIRPTVTKLYSGSKNMFWEYSPSAANIASDWLRAESSPVNEEEIKMDDCVDTLLTSEGIDLFVDLWEAQPRLLDPK